MSPRWRHRLGTAPATPVPPERVRLSYTDGTESAPLPLVYLGQQGGLAVWEAMAPAQDERTPSGVLVGACPPRTVVRLAV